MEAVRVRHVSLPTVKQAKNSDKIVEDKGGEEGGKTRNRGGRKAKIDGGEMSHVDFTESAAQMAAYVPHGLWLYSFVVAKFLLNSWRHMTER